MFDSRRQTTLFFVASSLIYASLFLIEPLRRRLGDAHITLSDDRLFWMIVVLFFLNFLLYLYFYFRLDFSQLSFKTYFTYYLILNALLLFVWPITSSDIMSYIYQGRIFAIYGANPYLNVYNQFGHDQFYQLIVNRWSGSPTPYGALFVAISGVLAWLGKSSLIVSVYLFKALFVGANILTGYLVYKVGSLKSFFLYALNPFIILEFAVNGHNDALVALLVVLSYYFLQKGLERKNQLLATLFLIASALIKPTTVILWPILGLLLLRHKASRREGVKFFLQVGLLLLVALIAAYAPFGDNWRLIYEPIMKQAEIHGYYSLGVYFIFPLVFTFYPIKSLEPSLLTARLIFSALYLGVILWLATRKTSVVSDLFIKYSTIILALFYLTSVAWLMPWYFTLPMLFAVLSYQANKEKIYLAILYFFTFYGLILYSILR